MKVTFVNTSDCKGGAAIACKRLMNALNKNNIDVNMVVASACGQSPHIIDCNAGKFKKILYRWKFLWERLVIFFNNSFSRKRLFDVSTAETGTNISTIKEIQEADIIHLHWINQGMLSLHDIKKILNCGKPIVWTMHDMWPITGICHYAWDCFRYETGCGSCPQLSSYNKKDLSYRTGVKKESLFRNIHFVAVSSWLKNCADKSYIGRNNTCTVIPNVIDTGIFFPRDKEASRNKFAFLPTDRILVFGAAKLNSPIKGFDLLKKALEKPEIQHTFGKNILLVLFGDIKNDPDFLKNVPCRYMHLGIINDTETLAELYTAADMTVSAAHYETFGQTLIESMACGTPVVSFNSGGQQDIILHKKTGYLAAYPSTEDLSQGIFWVLKNTPNNEMEQSCIERVNTLYSSSAVASRYIQFYKQILSR